MNNADRTDDTLESRQPGYMNRAEFLELQARNSVLYEYISGIIRLVPGASLAHCLVTQNFSAAIRARLRHKEIEQVYTSEPLTVSIGGHEIIYRPDLFVMREQKSSSHPASAVPKLVVEVTSPLTEPIDRREKLVNYSHLHSLDEYVVAAQSSVHVTVYRRSEGWTPCVVNSLRESVWLTSFGVSIPLLEIYEQVFSGRRGASSP